ncbi:hypothetical protein Tco_1520122 [Tanacetum coccineum]
MRVKNSDVILAVLFLFPILTIMSLKSNLLNFLATRDKLWTIGFVGIHIQRFASHLLSLLIRINSAQAALNLSRVKLGISEIRVTHSKSVILPVNPSYVPQSEDEIEKCARTVCCTNIDNQV